MGEVGVAGGAIAGPALSPESRRVAASVTEGRNKDVWVYDLTLGVRTRLSTAVEVDNRPVWSPDGEQVAFTSYRSGVADILLCRADGTGEEKALAADPTRAEMLSDWSRDGRYLLYTRGDPETGFDLWYLERGKDASAWEAHPFLQTPFGEAVARISPDGRYVAYISDDSGRLEIYVRPFPEGDRRWTVSSNGGKRHHWSRDGKELFYVEGDDTLVAVSVSLTPDFTVGPARRLFRHQGLTWGVNYPPYDVSADRQRFLLIEPFGEQTNTPVIRVVQNWLAEFPGRQTEKQ
jgi:dipeptidyl aminopeptidase/acylaminoacyl peptidase